jgi:enoyl-CoA hydratase/carnithine racemase
MQSSIGKSSGIALRWSRNFSTLLRVDKSVAGKVITISLNNEHARNALTRTLMTEMVELLTKVADSDSARVIVLRSSLPKVFCSGHHLKEVVSQPDMIGLFSLCSDMMLRLRAMPQAVIAEVDGLATAAGCQLVASCDLAIASEEASFATPGVSIGLFCSTPAVALARTVSHKHAMEMLLTGDVVDAAHALRIGLVNRVVPRAQLGHAVAALSAQIAGKSGSAIRIGKENYWRQVEVGEARAYAMSAATMAANMEERDASEGIRAFLEKRPPAFD